MSPESWICTLGSQTQSAEGIRAGVNDIRKVLIGTVFGVTAITEGTIRVYGLKITAVKRIGILKLFSLSTKL